MAATAMPWWSMVRRRSNIRVRFRKRARFGSWPGVLSNLAVRPVNRVAVLSQWRWSARWAMAVPCMSADVLLWRGQVLWALATASAGQISFSCWRPGPAASGAAGRLPAAAAGPAGPGLRGMSLWVSDSGCWRAGVAAGRARRDRACVPGGRRDPPGTGREADAAAVTPGEFPPGGRGRTATGLAPRGTT